MNCGLKTNRIKVGARIVGDSGEGGGRKRAVCIDRGEWVQGGPARVVLHTSGSQRLKAASSDPPTQAPPRTADAKARARTSTSGAGHALMAARFGRTS